jgi:hypothetical protein
MRAADQRLYPERVSGWPSARLPTVIIRPGKPNAAASSFASAVFREPLKGEDYVLPVALETVMPVLGYRNIVEGILALHELPADKLGDDRRCLCRRWTSPWPT